MLLLLKRWTPLLSSILGLFSLGTLAILQWMKIPTGASAKLFQGGAAFLYLGWLVWESQISIQETQNTAEDHDQHTLEFAAMTKYLLLFACLWKGAFLNDYWGSVGILGMISGIGLRVMAIRELGKSYSHRIRLPALPLKTGRPYTWVRHPAYLGTALTHTGLVLIFSNPLSWVALGAWYLVVYLRARTEDRWLMTKVLEYRNYAQQVPWRLLPGIW